MLNKYPLWKYLLVLFVVGLGLVYAAPNLYKPDPALQITGESSAQLMDEDIMGRALTALDEAGIEHFGELIDPKGRNGLVRLRDAEEQLVAQARVSRVLGDGFIVALNLAPTTPQWLSDIGAQPVKLGLDLRGGVHFKLEVDVDAAIERRMEYYLNATKRALREDRIRGYVNLDQQGRLETKFKSESLREQARAVIAENHPELVLDRVDEEGSWNLYANMTEASRKEIADYAVSQNLTTLRNRVNELGVSEPLVQRQGQNRIVVELAGIQDTAEAKRILGKVANLEFRMVARLEAPAADKQRFEYRSADRAGMSEWLERDVILTGERVSNAQASFDQNGMPNVQISLDNEGGTAMSRATRNNIKRRMGVLFIERKYRTRYEMQEDGTEIAIKTPYDEKKLLTAPVIQSALGAQFQITGLDSPMEAAELALMLRAGALAAPISFVEERTVGPSLGAENIRLGVKSVQIGLALVVVFMILYYRVFGVAAVIALSANLVLLIAFMSIIGATLTLPGIAGIVLTVGMAVDANVLIFSRIREELRNGLSPQMAIHAGYERAVSTILDANITTLIVAVILYAVGTGPVKGFAVTLSVGIVTSMFTAIMGTRAITNLIYGGRRVEKLSIGGGV
ncbi:protein-export membrane protein SecD [Halioglobus japonicus]|uniref:Protein translocase subunit SecD n=1 Tax=Halioglobus japonicus TaxID=930805 RepID=A0AAP8MGC0_9GAMM|nr:protein translocase subunit SecD [Halioglobus japonicus]AQA19687.1 protein-export membrane protein SecD [Halioglobus japonicus]PLW87245.1 protein translocase subunit SecD [Halioglobus japonicus]GHD09446.1 protein translocase subunit SecD [Halioglobus japonicus]